MPAVYKPAKNGGHILVINGVHEFNNNKDDGKKVHYVCRLTTRFGRKVTAAVCKATDHVVRVHGDHLHDTDLLNKIAIEKEEEAVKTAAQVPTVPPCTIMANLVAQLQNIQPMSVNYLSKNKTFARKVQRERNKYHWVWEHSQGLE